MKSTTINPIRFSIIDGKINDNPSDEELERIRRQNIKLVKLLDDRNTVLTRRQIKIIERLDLKPTGRTFGVMVVYKQQAFEYKPGIYIAFTDIEGRPKRDICLLFNDNFKTCQFSNFFLSTEPVIKIRKKIDLILNEHFKIECVTNWTIPSKQNKQCKPQEK